MYIVPPNVSNEMAILGCFLIDSSLYEEKREVLDESMFYDSHTKLIF
jgi:replicative DNA helicase